MVSYKALNTMIVFIKGRKFYHPRLRDEHWRLGVWKLLIIAVRHHPRLRDEH